VGKAEFNGIYTQWDHLMGFSMGYEWDKRRFNGINSQFAIESGRVVVDLPNSKMVVIFQFANCQITRG